MPDKTTAPLQPAAACLHCGKPAPGDTAFCCAGCESVHDLLLEKGLGHFYTLRERFSFQPPAAAPAEETAEEPWNELTGAREAKLRLEGIHCLGCLWLLEKLPELEPGVERASLDISRNLLEVAIDPAQTSWGSVARLIHRLGYEARPLQPESEAAARAADARRQLARIGVAAFSAGNIMLLSVSIYGGADPWWGLRFGWLSLALALPALTYSAWPLYRAALAPLRYGRLSVDLAVVLAILAGVAMSLWSLARGSEQGVYLDSLTMLVFLLLSSRYLLSRFREKLAGDGAGLAFLSGERFERLSPDPGRVAAGELRPGDELLLRDGQTLPVDATLTFPEARLDLSLLTGESEPVRFLAGDSLEAGSRVVGAPARAVATRPAGESRLARLLEQVRLFELGRSPSVAFADRLGKRFVLGALSLATLLLLLLPGEEGLRRALALVIVTCPCVLAFAVPLAFTRAMQSAARRGILFLAPEKIEELAGARRFLFDKTGTLTNGQFELLEWRQLEGSETEARTAALSLESLSRHPVARAIARALAGGSTARVEDFLDTPGRGVSGRVNGALWEVVKTEGDADPAGRNSVSVRREGRLVATLFLGDALRPSSAPALRGLEEIGASVCILSGDREDRVAGAARALGVKVFRHGLSPERKATLAAEERGTVMVGDGANDAIAFRGASVGIAVQGAMELGLRSSDVLLTRPGISGVLEATLLARSTMRLVRRSFALTFAYNLLAGSLAAAGLMEPLWAAVLMPLSALSVFTYTYWSSREPVARGSVTAAPLLRHSREAT